MVRCFLLSAAACSLSPTKVMRMSGPGTKHLCPAALAAHRWQTRMPKLWMPDLLRLLPHARSTGLALQGVPCRFLCDFRHLARVAQISDVDQSDGHRGVLQRI